MSKAHINEFYLVYSVALALGFSRKESWGLATRAISKTGV